MTIYEKTAHGTEILMKSASTVRGKEVSLTRKTTKAGEIKHGVVLTSTQHGYHRKVGTFTELAPAFKLFKALAQE